MIRPWLGFIPVICFVVAVGCARRGPAANPLPLDPELLTPIERKAAELTTKHALNLDLTWGKPYAIQPLGPGWESILGERSDCFDVRFWTPESEIPLLGDRAILVNVKTGKTILAPRD